jgi:hypothetical protein
LFDAWQVASPREYRTQLNSAQQKYVSPENNHVVETLATHAAEKSLANRIHERSLDRRPNNADTGRGAIEVGATGLPRGRVW